MPTKGLSPLYTRDFLSWLGLLTLICFILIERISEIVPIALIQGINLPQFLPLLLQERYEYGQILLILYCKL